MVEGPPAPLTREHLSCPFATDALLRAESPVHYVADEQVWVVSRYDDVQEALRRPEVFSNRFGRVIRSRDRLPPAALEILAEGWPPVDTLFTTDPPEHRRFRALVSKAFTPRRVAAMAGDIRAVAGACLDTMLASGGPVDVVASYAVPLPLTVIADQLGVPRDDLPLFKRWSEAVVSELSRLASPEQQLEAARATVEFQHYFHARIEERRRTARDDMLSELVHARSEDGPPLTDAELLMMLTQLLVAGNETTTNGITSAVWLLATQPELQAAVRAEPARIAELVEETLRLEAPIQGMWRVVTDDVELGGVTIPRGASVMLRYGSANRDETHYDAADRVRLDREAPRDHLAFGGGIHFCIGAALARSEMSIALELLLSRTSWIDLVPGQDLTRPPHLLIRGLPRLVVTLAGVSPAG